MKKRLAAAMCSALLITNGDAGVTSVSRSRNQAAKMRVSDFIWRQDARRRVIVGLFAAVIVFVALRGYLGLWSAAIAGWNAFAGVILVLDWMTIRTMPQRKIRERAQQEDLSRLLVFIFVVMASFAALCAVVFFVRVHKGQMHQHFLIHLLLTLSTVISAWALLHTVYSFRYAHAFYGDSGEPGVQKD